MQNLRVLINGGGISGLTLALSLIRNHGIAPIIVDASQSAKSKLSEGGIVLSPLSMKLLEDVDTDVADIVRNRGQLIQTFNTANESSRSYGKLRFENFTQKYDLPAPVGIMKWELINILETAIQSKTGVVYNNRLLKVAVTKSGKLSPSFSKTIDAPRGTFDVVVGADGPASTVRGLWKPSDVQLKPCGYSCWSMVVDRPASVDPSTVTEMWGPGRRLFVFPVSSTELMLWGTVQSKYALSQHKPGKENLRKGSVFKEEFAPFFSGGGLHAIWRNITDEGPKARTFQPPKLTVERKVLENHPVVLMGDAAHCVSPTIMGHGGAGLAIEDAVSVADALGSGEDFMTELQAYSKSNRREQFIQKQAHRGDMSAITDGKFKLAMRHTVMKWKCSSFGLRSNWRALAQHT